MMLYLEWQLLCRDRQLDEREAGVALREQRVGGMDADLLATFGALPNGNSSASKEVSVRQCDESLDKHPKAGTLISISVCRVYSL